MLPSCDHILDLQLLANEHFGGAVCLLAAPLVGKLTASIGSLGVVAGNLVGDLRVAPRSFTAARHAPLVILAPGFQAFQIADLCRAEHERLAVMAHDIDNDTRGEVRQGSLVQSRVMGNDRRLIGQDLAILVTEGDVPLAALP